MRPGPTAATVRGDPVLCRTDRGLRRRCTRLVDVVAGCLAGDCAGSWLAAVASTTNSTSRIQRRQRTGNSRRLQQVGAEQPPQIVEAKSVGRGDAQRLAARLHPHAAAEPDRKSFLHRPRLPARGCTADTISVSSLVTSLPPLAPMPSATTIADIRGSFSRLREDPQSAAGAAAPWWRYASRADCRTRLSVVSCGGRS